MERWRELYAYLAGLMDGEGTITIVRNNKKGFQPSMAISLSHKDTLIEIQSRLKQIRRGAIEVKFYSNNLDLRKASYKQMHVLMFTSRYMMLKMLKQLIPFLITKHQQAIILKEFIERRIERQKTLGYQCGFDEIDTQSCDDIHRLNGSCNSAEHKNIMT